MMLMVLGLVVLAIIVGTAFRLVQGLRPVPARTSERRVAARAGVMDAAAVKRALTENLTRAQHSGDPLWLYDAQAALTDYLPTTLALHARTHGTAVTPELEAALANILHIATARQVRPDEDAWKIHQRFLQARAEEGVNPASRDPLKL